MEAVLNYDSPDAQKSKGEQRAQQQSLLAALRAQQQEAAKRAKLLEAIKRTEDAIADERIAKRHLALQARELRVTMERLAGLTGELAAEKARREAYLAARTAEAQRKAVPLDKTKPSEGLLTFYNAGFEQYPPERTTVAGPSSKRTAYVTDYTGRLLVGAKPPKSETQKYERAAREVDLKRSATRDELTLPRINSSVFNSSGAAGGGGTLNGSPHSAVIRSDKLITTNTDGSIGANNRNAFGKPSRVDIDKCKSMSSKRSRYYTDYEGKQIGMDPTDWPQTNGLVLL